MATLYFTGDGTQWNTLANWYTNSARTTPASSLPLSTDDVDAILTGDFAYNATPITANSAIFRINSSTSRVIFSRPLNIATTVHFIGKQITGSNNNLQIGSISSSSPLTITANTMILALVTMGDRGSTRGPGGAIVPFWYPGGIDPGPVTLNVDNLQIIDNTFFGPAGTLTIKDNCNITVGKKYNIVSTTNTSPISVTLSEPHNYTSGVSYDIAIEDHLVNTNANGAWTITVTGPSTFTLNGSTGNGTGGATGTSSYYKEGYSITKIVTNNSGDVGPVYGKPILGNNFNIALYGASALYSQASSLNDSNPVFNSNNHTFTFNDRSYLFSVGISSANNIIFQGKSSRSRLYNYGRILQSNPTPVINGNLELRDDVIFNNSGGVTVTGDVIFTQSIFSNNPFINGTINGNLVFSSATPVIFRLENTSSWTGQPMSSSWIFNNGEGIVELNDSAKIGASTTITCDIVLNDSSYIDSGIMLILGGDITFNNSSYTLGTITAANQSSISFNDSSFRVGNISGTSSLNYNGLTGFNIYGLFLKGDRRSSINIPITITNLATFGGSSANQNTLTGNSIFKERATNLGVLNGDVIFRNKAYNQKDISGTVTLDYDKGVNGSSILGMV